MPKASDLVIDYSSKPNEIHVKEGLEKGVELLYRSNNRVYGYYRKDCGHYSFLHYGAVRKARTKFKCKECTFNQCAEEADAVGLELIERVGTSDYNKYVSKSCNHELILRAGNVKRDIWACSTCDEEDYKLRQQSVNVELLDETLIGDKMLYRLGCGHEKYLTRGAISKNSFRCRICQDETYSKDAEKQGIEYLKDVKSSHHDYRVYRLSCGCVKELTMACVKHGAFECKTHHERSIDKSQPIYVYLIKINLEKEPVIKVGYSYDLTGRSCRYARYGVSRSAVEPIVEILFDDGNDAVSFEKEVHSTFKHTAIDKDELKGVLENGFTECYPITLLSSLEEYFTKKKQEVLHKSENIIKCTVYYNH
jgi:hypothetical protein